MIDGQQRLATLTLLLAALRDHIGSTGWYGDEESPTVDLLDDLFLKNRNFQGDRKYKLSLRRTDDATLHALVDGKGLDSLDGNPSGQIANAYQFFKEKLNDCDPAAVYNNIASLRIVEVTLHLGVDDPQFVFESLNDTGVDLSPGDMVRNYLLMSLEEQEQTRLYTEYWSKVESYFRDADGRLNDDLFNSFLQNYLELKRKGRQLVPGNRLYEEFKKYKDTLPTESTLEQLLVDIRRFASYHAAFRGHEPMPSQRLIEAMRNVHLCGTTPTTLIMRLCDSYHRQQTLTEGEFVRALGLIESYLLRRAVMGYQTRWGSYWGIFTNIAHNIVGQSPVETVERFLRSQGKWYWPWRFPDDEEFARALQESNLYWLDRTCKRILDRLENEGSQEPSPVGEYTIEHIMPQTMTAEWREMLGEDWEEIHPVWLHRLGNLTLTAYNSAYSNLPFEKKKTTHGGFNESAVRLNKFIREQPQWTAAEMEVRGKELAERALKIWPYPRV